ncbi:hypothetical protein RCL1_002209 [Eukaryota sp. TZLM3-RCL]
MAGDDVFNELIPIPRDYQVELYEKSQGQNSVIFMKTGTGKTLIAFMRMIQAKITTLKPALMIAPTRALIEQHVSSWSNDVKTLKNIGKFMGEVPAPSSMEDFINYDVIFATPGWIIDQLFLNCNQTFSSLAQVISLYVVDEVHHIGGKTPAAALTYEWDNAGRPLPLLGLSASPIEASSVITAHSNLQTFLASIGAVLLKPDLHEDQYKSHSNEIKVHIKKTSPRPLPIFCITALIEQATNDIEQILQDNVGFVAQGFDLSETLSSSPLSEDILFKFTQMKEALTSLHEMVKQINIIEEDSTKNRAYNDQRLASVYNNINAFCNELRTPIMQLINEHKDNYFAINDVNSLLVDPFASFQRQRELDQYRDLTVVMAPVWAAISNLTFTRSTDLTHQEVDVLGINAVAETIHDEYTKSHNQSDFKCLVLCQTRAGARAMSIALQNHPTLDYIQCDYVIGRQRDGVSMESVNTQKIGKLRTGQLNCLVGTSVLKEGIDVPHCSLVVQTQLTPSGTDLVQVSGRVRAKTGKFVAIIVAHNQEEYAQKAQGRAALMQEIARNAAQSSDIISANNNLLSKMPFKKVFDKPIKATSSPTSLPIDPSTGLAAQKYQRFKINSSVVTCTEKNPVSQVNEFIQRSPIFAALEYTFHDSMATSSLTSDERFTCTLTLIDKLGDSHPKASGFGRTKAAAKNNAASNFLVGLHSGNIC